MNTIRPKIVLADALEILVAENSQLVMSDIAEGIRAHAPSARVVSASNGATVAELADQGRHFDVLIMSGVLPDINAAITAQTRNALADKVIYIGTKLPERIGDAIYVQSPFTDRALAHALERAISAA